MTKHQGNPPLPIVHLKFLNSMLLCQNMYLVLFLKANDASGQIMGWVYYRLFLNLPQKSNPVATTDFKESAREQLIANGIFHIPNPRRIKNILTSEPTMWLLLTTLYNGDEKLNISCAISHQ